MSSTVPTQATSPIPRWLGVTLLLIIATMFAANHIAARFAFDNGANVLFGVLVRSSVTALAVLAVLLVNGVPLTFNGVSRWRMIAVGLLICSQSYCLYSAVALIPVGLALLVFNTSPLIMALVSWATGGERPTHRTMVVMPIALAGLALALDPFGWSGAGSTASARWHEIGAGVGFGLGAALSFVFAMQCTTRWLTAVDGRVRSCVSMATVAVVVAAVGMTTEGFAMPRDPSGWFALACLTVLYGTGFTAVFSLLPKLGAVNNVAVLNFEPIAALFLAWLILGQTMAPLQMAGAVVVIVSIVIAATGKR